MASVAQTKQPEATAAKPAAPSFTLDELRSAVEAAREEERLAERQAAATTLEARRAAALALLAEQVAGSRAQAAQVVEDMLGAFCATALSMVATVLPNVCARHGADEATLLLRGILQPLRQGPDLQIRIHPAMRGTVSEAVADVLEGSGSDVTWIESDALAPGDLTVRWANGEAARDTRALCRQVQAAVLTLFPGQPGPNAENDGV